MKNRNDNQKPNGKSLKNWVIGLGIFCAILLAANIWTIAVYAPSRDNKNGSTDHYDLLNPARKFVNQKDLIINFQPLRDYLNEKYETDPNVSIYFEYLPTGANIAISKDAKFYPASMLKVPITMAVARKIDRGEWRWDNKLVLMATDKNDKFGNLYKEPTGSIFTIEELVRHTLVDSDNTSNSILLRNLEKSEINEINTHIGLSGFVETDGSISAKRYSVILRALYNSSYLTEENSQKVISFLSNESSREYLGSGIPADITFAHKIGIEADKKIYLDSGIIYFKERPYILTVMTKNKDEENAKKIMKDISERAYNYVRDYQE